MGGSHFFATLWLGLGKAEILITADKRLRCFVPPAKLSSALFSIRKTSSNINMRGDEL